MSPRSPVRGSRRERTLSRVVAALLSFAAFAACNDAPTAPTPTDSSPHSPPTFELSAATPVPVSYTAHLLGDLGVPRVRPVAINGSGVAVGFSRDALGSTRAIRWLPDGTPEALPLSNVFGIADDGTIGGNDDCRLAVWHPGAGLTYILADPAEPYACIIGMSMSRSGTFVATSNQYSADPGNYVVARTATGQWEPTRVMPPAGYRTLRLHDVRCDERVQWEC